MRYEIISDSCVFKSCVQLLGCSSDTNITRFGPGSRNYVIIHYCTCGKGYFNGNPVNEGEGFIIRPKDFEEYYPDKENPWTILWFVITTDNHNDFLCLYKENPETHIFKYGFTDEIKRLQNELKTAHLRENGDLYNIRMFLKVLELHSAENGQRANNSMQRYAALCKQYIELYYYQKLTVEDIAKSLNISESYLYRSFVKEIGVSPKQYLVNHRMNKAKALLRNTEFNITEVANSVGFDDVLAFSRAFKSYEHISPTDYRKMIAAN